MIRSKNYESDLQYPNEVLQLLEEIKNKSLPQSLSEMRKLPRSEGMVLIERVEKCIKMIQDYMVISGKQNVFASTKIKEKRTLFYHGVIQNLSTFEKQIEKQAKKNLSKFYEDMNDEIYLKIKQLNAYHGLIDSWKYINGVD